MSIRSCYSVLSAIELQNILVLFVREESPLESTARTRIVLVPGTGVMIADHVLKLFELVAPTQGPWLTERNTLVTAGMPRAEPVMVIGS
jgi:hypothetical protein